MCVLNVVGSGGWGGVKMGVWRWMDGVGWGGWGAGRVCTAAAAVVVIAMEVTVAVAVAVAEEVAGSKMENSYCRDGGIYGGRWEIIMVAMAVLVAVKAAT